MVVGNNEAPLHHPIGIGQSVGGNTELLAAEHWLPCDIAGPNHASVDAVGFHPLLKLGATDSGVRLNNEREHMPARFDPFGELGKDKQVWVLREM